MCDFGGFCSGKVGCVMDNDMRDGGFNRENKFVKDGQIMVRMCAKEKLLYAIYSKSVYDANGYNNSNRFLAGYAYAWSSVSAVNLVEKLMDGKDGWHADENHLSVRLAVNPIRGAIYFNKDEVSVERAKALDWSSRINMLDNRINLTVCAPIHIDGECYHLSQYCSKTDLQLVMACEKAGLVEMCQGQADIGGIWYKATQAGVDFHNSYKERSALMRGMA